MAASPLRRSRTSVLVAGLVLAAAGCGSGTPSSKGGKEPASPALLDVCASVTGTWRTLRGVPVEAAYTGSGSTVVLVNDSGNSPCEWLDLARQLSAAHHRVVVFAYDDASSTGEKQAVKDTIALARAAAGKDSYALVGASLGGRVVIEAAAQHPAKLAAIVSLSGEAEVKDLPDITAQAQQVSTPALYVGSRQDSYTHGVQQQNALHAAMHGDPNDLVQLPGSAHGVALLTGASGAQVTSRVVGFVGAQLH